MREQTKQLQAELSQKLFETMRNTTHGQNLYKGIEVACYPLSDEALTSNETMTIYNYRQLQALKDLVSLQGNYDVEVQYLDSEYPLYGEAIYNIDYFLELATRFPEVPAIVINYVIDNYGDVEDVEEILTVVNEGDSDFNYAVINAEDEMDAFFEFIDIFEYFNDIPAEYHRYINWEQLFTDNVTHGTMNIKQIGTRQYLMIDTKEY